MQFSRTVLILLAIVLLSCGGRGWNAVPGPDYSPQNAWIFEGWACSPKDPERKPGMSPADYCQTENIKKNNFLYMKFSVRSPAATPPERQESACRREAVRKVRKSRMEIFQEYLGAYSCAAEDCGGGLDPAELRRMIRNSGIYDCCALDPETGLCAELPDWRECTCVAFFEWRGGQSAFNTADEDI